MSDLLLPPGTRLVHIGPPKTATTSLQSAFHAARPVLDKHDVHYAGKGRHAMLGAIAAAGGRGFLGGPKPARDDWAELVEDIVGAQDKRVVFSSEYLAQAKPAAVQRIVDDLGDRPVHVVLTLRPLHKILPSQWQQYIQTGYSVSYEQWLREMFSESPRKGLTPSFWTRHHHDQLAQRWADVVGPDNVTVVVLDPNDHAAVLRTFEAMVGLPDGVLKPRPDLSNRSLTFGEVELVRAFNQEFRQCGWAEEVHFNYFRNGSIRWMKRREPGREEAKIVTPTWALEQVANLTEKAVAAIEGMGVRIIGDASTLVCPHPDPAEGQDQAPGDERVRPDVAVLSIAGAVAATNSYEQRRAMRRRWRTADQFTSRELLGILRRRLTHREQ